MKLQERSNEEKLALLRLQVFTAAQLLKGDELDELIQMLKDAIDVAEVGR